MKLITKAQNRFLHGLLNELDAMGVKDELVMLYSSNRTKSSKDLTMVEATTFINELKERKRKECKKMWGKIIHHFCLMGYVDDDGKADMKRINGFVMERGSGNKKKKNLFQLTRKELFPIVTQVEQILKKHLKK